MKKLFLIIPLVCLLSSCQVDGPLTHSPTSAAIDTGSQLKYTGSFMATSGISVTGKVKIYFTGNRYQLQLENFSISEGPDLKVYLSKSATPNDFVNLGNLTEATLYNIPASVTVSDYSYVLIHCQQYNHLFAIAPLTSN